MLFLNGEKRLLTVLVADDLPELGADLVTALAALDVADWGVVVGEGRGRREGG